MSYTAEKSAPNSGGRPDRPFHPKVVQRARDLSARFEIRIIPDDQSGCVGRVAELPTVFGCGETDDQALKATRELLQWALAYLIERGRSLPVPITAWFARLYLKIKEP
jgi:predicted RNase H-like HicB family nuclease